MNTTIKLSSALLALALLSPPVLSKTSQACAPGSISIAAPTESEDGIFVIKVTDESKISESHYSLERSQDGKYFEPIHEGQAFSSISDSVTESGSYQYRLTKHCQQGKVTALAEVLVRLRYTTRALASSNAAL